MSCPIQVSSTTKISHFHSTQKHIQNKSEPTQTIMSKPKLLPLTLLCIPLLLQIWSVVSLNPPTATPQIDVLAKRVCNSTVEDCLADPEMDSETTRRVLVMQKRYISYDTLRRDMVPCEKSGASYYECHAPQANPYGRGCTTITRCRGS